MNKWSVTKFDHTKKIKKLVKNKRNEKNRALLIRNGDWLGTPKNLRYGVQERLEMNKVKRSWYVYVHTTKTKKSCKKPEYLKKNRAQNIFSFYFYQYDVLRELAAIKTPLEVIYR